MTYAPAPIITPADLWGDVRAWLGVLMKRFGGPARILLTFAARTRAAIKRRLAALDALVLKLLLIEAARLAPQPMPARAAAATRRANPIAHHPEDPANPETWRVRYSPRLPRPLRRTVIRRACRRAPPRDPAAIARTLARRCEALRRLIADPRPAVRILARKLRALGPAADDIARRIAFKPPTSRSARIRLRLAHATIFANEAVDAINSS